MGLFDLPTRVFRAARFGARELYQWRRLSQQIGIRPALIQRVRENLGLQYLDALRSEVASLHELAIHADGFIKGEARPALDVSRREASAFAAILRDQQGQLNAIHQKIENEARVAAFTRWTERVVPTPDTLVSIILPTRNRSDLVARAIASVVAQDHPHWELLVANDGSTDNTSAVVNRINDPRIRLLDLEHGGVSRARNRALAEAKGSVIVYLDDDNLMWPGWLKSAAWAFGEHPEADVLYGARLVEKVRGNEPARPYLHFEPYDRAKLEHGNTIDMGVVAHRAGLPEAKFDESLEACVDWDLVLRLTREKAPLALPVIACAYSLSARGRISARPSPDDIVRQVRARHAPKLRVLAYNSLAPMVTETYILDEVLAVERQGAAVAFCRQNRPSAPVPVAQKLYTDLDEAVAEFKPDMLLVHWTTHALAQAERLQRVGVPFAVRVHSFDSGADALARVQAHPFCIGVWAYPHHAAKVPGVHPFVPILTPADEMPEPAPVRDLVISCPAGLPKKDWDLLLASLNELRGVERRIVLGVTNAHEDMPGIISKRLLELDNPPMLHVNLDRQEIFRLLSRSAVLIYMLVPGGTFGMPMSPIEAMCAGACVIVPDREEARALTGPGFRGYRTKEDVVAHVREILRGGPSIEAEQAENRRWARDRYANPETERRFFEELQEALQTWKLKRAPAPEINVTAGRLEATLRAR